jgi:threonine/homoserine/homoserine lactone efflux protein
MISTRQRKHLLAGLVCLIVGNFSGYCITRGPSIFSLIGLLGPLMLLWIAWPLLAGQRAEGPITVEPEDPISLKVFVMGLYAVLMLASSLGLWLIQE